MGWMLRLHGRLSAVPEGPEGELVAYAHAGIALAATIALSLGTTLSFGLCVVLGLGVYAALTACLLHRVTVWIAAALGTLVAAATTGAIGYAIGLLGAGDAWPLVGAAAGALVGALLAASAYRVFVRAVTAAARADRPA